MYREQDQEIDDLKQEFHEAVTLYKTQVTQNDNTIKEYKAEIDQTKEEAMRKFVKEIYHVRENLQATLDRAAKLNSTKNDDVELIK